MPVLAVAQSSDLEERIALLEVDAVDVITKPFDKKILVATIKNVVGTPAVAAGR